MSLPVGIALLAAAMLLAAALAWWRALRRTVAHAQGVAQGRLAQQPEPRVAGLREITRALNALARRQHDVDTAQAALVAALQRQAHTDALTGLPLRAPFIGRLAQQLADPGGPAGALLLVRLPELERLNQRLGHEGADRLLQALADLLLTYVQRVQGAFAGRLNGADFALCLPVEGVAAETAASLHAALATAPALRTGGVAVQVGAADGLRGVTAGAALAAADAALARAEMTHGLAVERPGDSAADPAGAREWHAQIERALAQGRVRLDAGRVVRQDGEPIHLACTLRAQLQPGGAFEAATRWLALARRSRLTPQADLAALELALAATATDGMARAVRLALPSLASAGFADDVAARLAVAPQATRRLSIEWGDDAGAADFGRLVEASSAWRGCGVRLGVLHAEGAPELLARWRACGVGYVKIEARHLHGAAGDAAVRTYAQGLLALVHGQGLQALAEGTFDADDCAALWALGFDGITQADAGAAARGDASRHGALADAAA